MIRYYGILANRVRSKLLPILYKFLGQTEKAQLILPSYSSLLISNFNLIKAIDFDLMILATSERGFGHRKEIHIWITGMITL